MKNKLIYGSIVLIIAIALSFVIRYALPSGSNETNESQQVQLIMDVAQCEKEDAERIIRALERVEIVSIEKAEVTKSHLTGLSGLKITDVKEQQYIVHYGKKHLVEAIQKDSIEGEYIYGVVK